MNLGIGVLCQPSLMRYFSGNKIGLNQQMIIMKTLFISILLAGTLVSLPVFGETKFYDRDWNLKYRMDDRGRIYDTDYNHKGRKQGDKVYDKDYNLKYHIKDNKVYDRNWNLEKRIDNDRIYDKNWNLKGRIKR